MKYCFGVDIGGTTVKMGLFSTTGDLYEKWEIKTRTENEGRQVLPDIAASIRGKMEEKGISTVETTGVGVGVPAPVREGVVKNSANIGWGYKNVKKEMEELLPGIRAEIGNDANVAALGEMWLGAGKGCSDMIMVTLGTGVGGGVICDGQVIAGANGAGGEIGHICVNYSETEKCGCGKTGCLEQYASATGIVRMTKKYLASSDEPSALRDQKQLTAKAIFDSAREGDGAALCLVGQLGEMLGRALSYISAVIDPEIFVLGGGVSRAGSILLDTVAENYRKCAFHASRKAKFELASLGNDAGIYGAARMVME